MKKQLERKDIIFPVPAALVVSGTGENNWNRSLDRNGRVKAADFVHLFIKKTVFC